MVQAWGQHEAAKAQIKAAQEQVTASEVALNGVREEARVGQRTTLDVLNAQQALVNARVELVTAQRDRVVGSYTLLSAVGRLSPQMLGLGHPDLRSDGALPAGPRRLGRRAHPGRTVGRGDVRLRFEPLARPNNASLAARELLGLASLTQLPISQHPARTLPGTSV